MSTPAVFTRCPGCQAVYELDATILGAAAGVVRCGNCGKTFNTLSQLYPVYPDENSEPVSSGGMPPLLEHPELVQAELPVMVTDLEEESDEDQTQTEQAIDTTAFELNNPVTLWASASAVLALALLVQTWMLWQAPNAPLAGWLGGGSEEVHSDPNEAIQIVSRDMHRHPSLDDAIVVSASLRNQEQFEIDFPIMEVRFYDASEQVLGARRVRPEEYLHDPDLIARGMPSGTVIPLLMEIVIGSTEPSGFQIRFY